MKPNLSGEITLSGQNMNTEDPSQWIKGFYILEAAIFSEELDERITLAAKIVSCFQTRAKLETEELTVVDDINNWIVQDLVNIRDKIPVSLVAGLITLSLEFGNRHWSLLASEFSAELASLATDTVFELWVRTGRTVDTRFLTGSTKPWQADYERNLLKFSKLSPKNDIESPEEAWQILYTNTLNDPTDFSAYFKELKKPLNSAQVKFRIYLLTLVFNIKSSTINIQNPVNIVRSHVSKRSDSYQLVLLTNISLFLQELAADKVFADFPKSILKTLENIRKLRRLDEVYLATAALHKILADKFGANIAKDLLHEHTMSTCMFSENGREVILSPIYQMMQHFEPGLVKTKNSRINLIRLKTGALLLITKLALTLNRDSSPKNIEKLWYIVGDILEAYPGDVSGLVHKMMQFAPTLHKYIPERVHSVIQKRYLDGVEFSNIDPESFITKYNEGTSNPRSRIKSFSRQPFAIGSLGQVFKGIASDGTTLAIKIKKPGIDKAIINQVRQAKPLEFLFKALNRNFNYLDLTNAMQDVFLQECDYEQEAVHQKIFFDLFKNHPKISVPAIFSEPNRDIIVQEFSGGMTFEDFIANSNQTEKNSVAELIVEAVLIQLKNGYFNYDIHPGNFLLTPDHSLILIDFGAVLSGDDLKHCSPWDIMHFIKDDDKEGLKNILLKSGFYREANLTDMQEKMTLFRSVYYRPFFTDGPFEVTDQLLRDIMTNQLEIELKTGRAICSSTRTVTVMRFYWSFYSVLARLNAKLNFAEKFQNANLPEGF